MRQVFWLTVGSDYLGPRGIQRGQMRLRQRAPASRGKLDYSCALLGRWLPMAGQHNANARRIAPDLEERKGSIELLRLLQLGVIF